MPEPIGHDIMIKFGVLPFKSFPFILIIRSKHCGQIKAHIRSKCRQGRTHRAPNTLRYRG